MLSSHYTQGLVNSGWFTATYASRPLEKLQVCSYCLTFHSFIHAKVILEELFFFFLVDFASPHIFIPNQCTMGNPQGSLNVNQRSEWKWLFGLSITSTSILVLCNYCAAVTLLALLMIYSWGPQSSPLLLHNSDFLRSAHAFNHTQAQSGARSFFIHRPKACV